MSQKFYGTVVAGKLTLHSPEHLKAALRELEGEVEMTVGRRGYRRSDRANARYWAILQEASGRTGFTPEELHDVCKAQFATKTKEILGQVYEFSRSTASMESREFSSYCDAVERWLREKGVLDDSPQEA